MGIALAARSRWYPVVFVVLMPLALAVSCRSDLLVQNRTDRELTVRVESAANPQHVGISGGSTDILFAADDTCLDGPLVAEDQVNGEEVARSDERACSGDIWVIEEDHNYITD